MDYRAGPEEEAFRREVRAFLRDELGAGWVGTIGEMDEDELELEAGLRKRLAGRGWLTLGWPKEHGGAGASIFLQMVLNEETAYHRAPARDNQAVSLVGPCIMAHGSEEQKRQHLPPIARGDVVWCQGFSEPAAGSDLASLQTRAVREGDDYVINGQKVWTTSAHRAAWMIVLTRTDPLAPKHRGITAFLLDMKTPGIEVRLLVNMAGGHGFNEVFFRNVRVPARNMLGPENRGWYVSTTSLNFERTAVGIPASAQRMLDDGMRYFAALPGGRNPLAGAVFKRKMAERYIEVAIGRLHSYRVGWVQSQGRTPDTEGSVARLYCSQMTQRVAATLMEGLGLRGQLRAAGSGNGFPALLSRYYLYCVGDTIGAGTAEIQRNIIATRGLGLPR